MNKPIDSLNELSNKIASLRFEEELKRSLQVLEYSLETCKHLLEVYNQSCKDRGGGKPLDREQDVLRAMLLFACSGLDSSIQNAVCDSLRRVVFESKIRGEDLMRNKLRDFAASEIEDKQSGNIKAISVVELLLAESPHEALIEKYINSFVGKGHSLQSFEALATVCDKIGLNKALCVSRKEELLAAFDVRNSIVHNMDVRFTEGKKPNHIARKKDEIVHHTRVVLQVGLGMLTAINEKLKPLPSK